MSCGRPDCHIWEEHGHFDTTGGGMRDWADVKAREWLREWAASVDEAWIEGLAALLREVAGVGRMAQTGKWDAMKQHGAWHVQSLSSTICSTHEREDAVLIAAAPDLLEALKRMGYLGRVGWCFCSERDSDESTQHQGYCKRARAAIAKAEGR